MITLHVNNKIYLVAKIYTEDGKTTCDVKRQVDNKLLDVTESNLRTLLAHLAIKHMASAEKALKLENNESESKSKKRTRKKDLKARSAKEDKKEKVAVYSKGKKLPPKSKLKSMYCS